MPATVSPSCTAARSPRRRANASSSPAASPSATASPGACCSGPAARPGNITLPVNIVVTDSKREKMTTDKMTVAVPVAVDNPIGYFSAVRSVTFDVPEGTRPGEFEVFVGFDQGAQGAG